MLFTRLLHATVATLAQLLGSKSVTDVLEAVQFFVTGFEFGLVNSMLGVRRMLALVWSKENSVKEAVVSAYKTLYLKNDDGANPRYE